LLDHRLHVLPVLDLLVSYLALDLLKLTLPSVELVLQCLLGLVARLDLFQKVLLVVAKVHDILIVEFFEHLLAQLSVKSTVPR